jgi:LmbE family N-acetylglucosaminyl deacetylase
VVLSCADLVAAHPGAAVITVMAGRPGPHALTEWDQAAGFAEGDDVVGRRQQEDEAALKELGALPVWLEFLDGQYGQAPSNREVADAIQEVILNTGASVVASPLGIAHDDHVMTASAGFAVARRMPGIRWLVYEDAIYRATSGKTDEAMARVRGAGLVLEEAVQTFPPAGTFKRAAIDCYASQLKALGDRWRDALEPERYWTVVARM